MNQNCIARTEEDARTLLADAEVFMHAMRKNPGLPLPKLFAQAPGIQVLDAEGDVSHVTTSPQRALDIIESPTNITLHTGNAAPRKITLLPETAMMDRVVDTALKSVSSPSDPAPVRPSADNTL